MLDDNSKRYGTVSRIFHWLMALLVAWQVLKLGDRIADGQHWVGQVLVPWHFSIGFLLLVLAVLRVAWALRQRRQRPPHAPGTAFLVDSGHVLLYALLLLMPTTGILYMVGSGYGLTVFGMQLVEKGPEIAWAASLGSLHPPLSWLLVTLVAGHIGIALIHHFFKRDGILQRML